ncbi:MAG: MATE family efflux transporter [Lachnospiraceae bacterium]|nr:MATE family efflux transporter [Lachnospiraceae bacterium]MDD6504010.1 MATE family efflux transporter [Lachnospiraceae bacterium]
MSGKSTKDMTVGSPMKLIIEFAVPMLLGMLFQQVYSLVDTMIVGRALGVEALAAVGSTGSINFMIIGFCLGVCSGFALPVAQRFGAKDYDGLRKYVGNSAILSGIIALIMTVATGLLCNQILVWMNTPDDIIGLAYDYIFVIFMGIPATILYNMLSGYLRSLGDSVTPLIFLIFSSVLNIGMDLLFILQFHMGVTGAALATVIAQGISGVLCLFVVVRKFDILHLNREDWRMDGHHVGVLLGMGLPMGFQYSITAIGSVILQTAVNGLGSTAVASMTAASKISIFMCCPFDALGSTMATYGGQNVGAGKLNRLSKGMWSAGILGIVYSIVILGVLQLWGQNLVYLFVDASEVVVVEYAKQFLIINAEFYIFLVFVNVVRFLIQGMGYSGFAVFAGVFEMIARTFVGMALVPIFGFTAACYASPFAWVLADAFLFPAYYFVLHRLQKRMAAQ